MGHLLTAAGYKAVLKGKWHISKHADGGEATADDQEARQADGIPTTPQGKPMVAQPNHIRCIIANDPDGEWKYARYFDPAGVEPEQYAMYQMRDGNGQPVDPDEQENLAHSRNAKAMLPNYVDKRAELAQRLATLEKERLQPLASDNYLPLVQRG